MKHYSDIIYSPVITEKSMAERQIMYISLKLLRALLKMKLN